MTMWILLTLLAVVVAVTVTAIIVRHRYISKISYMLDSLEDGELNFRFVENSRFNRALNRMRYIYERQRQQHEQDSWTKLIRVLTHEIMNTVTPIAALSDALSKSVDENGNSEMDIKAGLSIISDSSNNLIKFVQTYRQLSGVARPLRKAISLKELIDKTITLEGEHLSAHNAACTYQTTNPNLIIYADEGQIQQILINLIKNALQAGATRIGIESGTLNADEIFLRIANNGAPIPASNQEQIFIPFFTTKPDGSGIGLSISRQILRQHNATITLVKSDVNETVFEIVFK
ncbi:MAG: hypothetical protein IKZ99_09335 [Salinivirgaceae bacterium]|nr:hypothetical protein [Salinivirgaceae bacterium]